MAPRTRRYSAPLAAERAPITRLSLTDVPPDQLIAILALVSKGGGEPMMVGIACKALLAALNKFHGVMNISNLVALPIKAIRGMENLTGLNVEYISRLLPGVHQRLTPGHLSILSRITDLRIAQKLLEPGDVMTLAGMTQLTGLHLRNNDLGGGEIVGVIDCLTNLRFLTLRHCSIQGGLGGLVFKAIARLPYVKEIDVGDNLDMVWGLDPETAGRIVTERTEVLRIDLNRARPDAYGALMRSLAGATSLRKIDLSFLPHGDWLSDSIEGALRAISGSGAPLEEIVISNNEMHTVPGCMGWMRDAFRGTIANTLVVLDISSNYFASEMEPTDILRLVEGLTVLTALRVMNMESVTFYSSRPELVRVIGALPASLEELRIGFNCITDDDAASLEKPMERLTRLKRLCMRGNKMSPCAEGARVWLGKMTTLTSLNLLCNSGEMLIPMGDRPPVDASYLSCLTNLTELNVSDNCITEADAPGLAAGLAGLSGCLRHLDICHNDGIGLDGVAALGLSGLTKLEKLGASRVGLGLKRGTDVDATARQIFPPLVDVTLHGNSNESLNGVSISSRLEDAQRRIRDDNFAARCERMHGASPRRAGAVPQ